MPFSMIVILSPSKDARWFCRGRLGACLFIPGETRYKARVFFGHALGVHEQEVLLMSVRPYRDIERRRSRQVFVGKVPVGGDAPITVQSMTNTLTHDVDATVAQIKALERAGADIVRVSCPDQESALALKEIVRQVEVPIVADIHFHYKRAIEAA